MLPGLYRIAAGVVCAGETAVRAGLLQRRAGLGSEPESAGVMHACRILVSCLEEDVTEAVEGVSLQAPGTDGTRRG